MSDAMDEHPGFVYFIRSPINGLIKIGFTNRDAANRVSSMNTGSSVPLDLLGVMVGGRRMEKRLHERFADLRLHGEWFRPDARLARVIERWAKPWAPELSRKQRRSKEEQVFYPGSEVAPRLRRLVEMKRGPVRRGRGSHLSAIAREAGVSQDMLESVVLGRRNPSAAWLARVLAAIPATERELWAADPP